MALDDCFPTDIFLSQCGVRGVAGREGPPGTIMTNSSQQVLEFECWKNDIASNFENFAKGKV